MFANFGLCQYQAITDCIGNISPICDTIRRNLPLVTYLSQTIQVNQCVTVCRQYTILRHMPENRYFTRWRVTDVGYRLRYPTRDPLCCPMPIYIAQHNLKVLTNFGLCQRQCIRSCIGNVGPVRNTILWDHPLISDLPNAVQVHQCTVINRQHSILCHSSQNCDCPCYNVVLCVSYIQWDCIQCKWSITSVVLRNISRKRKGCCFTSMTSQYGRKIQTVCCPTSIPVPFKCLMQHVLILTGCRKKEVNIKVAWNSPHIPPDSILKFKQSTLCIYRNNKILGELVNNGSRSIKRVSRIPITLYRGTRITPWVNCPCWPTRHAIQCPSGKISTFKTSVDNHIWWYHSLIQVIDVNGERLHIRFGRSTLIDCHNLYFQRILGLKVQTCSSDNG